MKAKTKELLNLISKKKAEMREAKINALIHEHTLKEKQKRMENRTPFDEWYDTWWERHEEKMSRYYMELDRRIDERLNKDVAKIHKQLFGY